MKKIFLALSSVMLMTSAASVFAMSSKQGMFEIMNKENAPIYVTLANGDKILFDKQAVGRFMGTVKHPIDINQETFLIVHPFADNEGERKVYSFTPGKNILVSFDRSFGLTPQSGKWSGVLPTSKGGIWLRNNVKQQDINANYHYEDEASILENIQLLKFNKQVKDVPPYDLSDEAYEEDIKRLREMFRSN